MKRAAKKAFSTVESSVITVAILAGLYFAFPGYFIVFSILFVVALLIPFWVKLYKKISGFLSWYKVWKRDPERATGLLIAWKDLKIYRSKFKNGCKSARIPIIPYVVFAQTKPYGWSALLRMPHGMPASEWTRNYDKIAAGLKARQVLLSKDERHAGQLHMQVWLRDPFSKIKANPYPGIERTSVLEPIEIGTDWNGKKLGLPVALGDGQYLSSLLVGMQGSGKSSALHTICAHLALADDCRLVIIDPKGGLDLGVWANAAVKFAVTPEEISAVFSEEVAGMRKRYTNLKEQGNTAYLVPSKKTPATVIVIDELAEMSSEVMEQIVTLLRLGRASGAAIIACTQRPTNDLISNPAIKALMHQRIVLKVSSAAEARYARGDDEARWVTTMGFPPGRCWVRVGSEPWTLGQMPILTPKNRSAIAARIGHKSDPEHHESKPVVFTQDTYEDYAPAVVIPAPPQFKSSKTIPVLNYLSLAKKPVSVSELDRNKVASAKTAREILNELLSMKLVDKLDDGWVLTCPGGF